MTVLLKKYKLRFYISDNMPKCDGGTIGLKFGFYIEWMDFKVIKKSEVEETISMLEDIISGQLSEREFDIVDIAIAALAQQHTTYFAWDYDAYTSPLSSSNHDYSMPTQDFKDIIVEWKAFVEKFRE